ncbi:hypothetical protein Tco_1057137 [Tanacetum coccineum]|uniref:DUF4283 domain-containing protein n=1 Tax=Tanacetum coccineum TaxID=301880 RepID=A0ABQ5H579_9ASTR
MEQMTTLRDLVGQVIQKKEEEKRIAEEQAAKDRYWKIPICYDDDEDNTIAITPVLPIEEPDNSLSMGDEHLDTIPATESDEVIKSSVEDLVPIPSESEGIPDKMCDVPLCENTTPLNALNEHSEIVVNSNDDNSSSDDDSPYGEDIEYVDASPPDVEIVSLEVVEIVDPELKEKKKNFRNDILLTIKDDILREKLLNINLLIAKIDALRDNPTPSSEVVIKSTSTFPNLFLEETNTFDNSIPESETFRFNLEEISSGSPTTHSKLSLPDYKLSTSDLNHEEFADELTHIMSLPNLECFKFKVDPDPGNLTSIDLGIRKNVSTTNVNVPLEDDQSSLFTYVVWIFLAFLTYPVVPPYLLSTRNEDTIFDPGISMYHSFMPDVSHRSGTFMKFNDFPDCEDSQVSTRVSHPQLHFGNPEARSRVMSDKGSKDLRYSNPARVNLEEHSSREAVAGVQQSKVSRVSSYPSIVVGDQTFFGIGEGDNVRVSTLAGRSSKNPNHAFPSSITNPEVGSFAAKTGELVRDVVDGVASNDCITSMNGDVITELFGVSLSTPKDIDAFTSDLELGAKFSIPRKVVETGKYGLTRIMMNSKGFFFFKFKSSKGLDDNMENGPWMIRNSPIILKKWSMDTRLCKEELTRILVWVKIHDVPIQVFSEDGLSIIASQLAPRCDECKIFGHVHDHCPKKVSSPPTVVTSNVVTSTVEKTNDGFQTVGKKKKKGKSKSTTGGQFVGPSVKQNVRYEPKATTSAPKKGATNAGNASKSSSMLKTTGTLSKKGKFTTSNPYSALDDESEEDVENVYDEPANLFSNSKTGGSSSFKAAG